MLRTSVVSVCVRRRSWSRYRDCLTRHPSERPEHDSGNPARMVSSRGEAHEAALSRLHERSREPFARQIDVAHDLAVDLDRALGDQPPRLARRAEPEPLDEQRRQVERIALRQRLLRAPPPGAWPSRTTRVKWSSAARAASSPQERPTMKRARASFASSGSPAGRLPLPDQAVPLGQQLVRDAHRAAEHLLRRRRQRDVVPDRGAHLRRRPTRSRIGVVSATCGSSP